MSWYRLKPDLRQTTLRLFSPEATDGRGIFSGDKQSCDEMGYAHVSTIEKAIVRVQRPGELIDVLDCPGRFLIISDRAKEIVKSCRAQPDLRFLPSTIISDEAIQAEDYWLVHASQPIDAVDRDKSEFEVFNRRRQEHASPVRLVLKSPPPAWDFFQVLQLDWILSARLEQSMSHAGIDAVFEPVSIEVS